MKILHKKSVIILLLFFILIAASLGGVQAVYFLYIKKDPNTWVLDDPAGRRYIKNDKEYAASEWMFLDNNWYYFNSDGYAVNGRNDIGGSTYLFSSDSTLVTGWVDIDGNTEYVTSDHTLLKGWQEIEGSKYYFDTNCFLVKGNVSLSETFEGEKVSSTDTFVFNSDGQLLNGWQKNKKGEPIYVNQDGILATGKLEINGEHYYFDDSGVPKTGWINESGSRYYYDENGVAATGLHKVNGTYYSFNTEGLLVTKDYLLEQLDQLDNTEIVLDSKKESEPEIIGFGGYTPDSSDISRLSSIIDDLPNCRICGFVMINLGNGQGIAYNVNQTVYSASCIKGPYIASLVNYKPELLDTRANAFQDIIMYSDNDLYSSTRKTYGREFFGDWCEEAHVSRDVSVYHYPQLNAVNLAKLWVQNYFFFNTDEVGRKIKDWYITPNASPIYTTLGTYTSDGVVYESSSNSEPSLGYRTESKAGWICEGKYHASTDGGIIYPDSKDPYVIAIITDMPSDLMSLEPLSRELNNIYEKTENSSED